jgi:hypothetical protein
MSATTLELPSGPAASAQWAAVAFVASYSSPGTRQAYATTGAVSTDWSRWPMFADLTSSCTPVTSKPGGLRRQRSR